MLALIKFIFLVLVAILGAAIATINPDLITINYYFGSLEVSLGILIFILLGLGTLIGLLVNLMIILRLRTENLSLRRQKNKSAHQLVES